MPAKKKSKKAVGKPKRSDRPSEERTAQPKKPVKKQKKKSAKKRPKVKKKSWGERLRWLGEKAEVAYAVMGTIMWSLEKKHCKCPCHTFDEDDRPFFEPCEDCEQGHWDYAD